MHFHKYTVAAEEVLSVGRSSKSDKNGMVEANVMRLKNCKICGHESYLISTKKISEVDATRHR